MAGEEQTDAGGKYDMSGRASGGGPRWWPISLKIFELLIACACIGLIDEPTNNQRSQIFISQRTVGLAYVTFGTFIILIGVYVLGKVVRDDWPWKTTTLLTFIGAIMFIATSAAVLADWANTKERNYWPPNTQRLDLLCATGFLSLVGGVVFLVDFGLLLRSGMKGRFEY